jgi:hypothetical protein
MGTHHLKHSITIEATTDENADCRASINLDGIDADYDVAEIDCTGDGTETHTCTPSEALPDNADYLVSVACMDTNGNKNTGEDNTNVDLRIDSVEPVVTKNPPGEGWPEEGDTLFGPTTSLKAQITEESICYLTLDIDAGFDDLPEDKILGIPNFYNPLQISFNEIDISEYAPGEPFTIIVTCADKINEEAGNKNTQETNKEIVFYKGDW